MPRHLLADKNVEDRTAVCSVCGPVDIRPVGKSWTCLNKKRESARAWREANPEKVAQSRHTPSTHQLLSKDPAMRRGVCPIDGEVDIVPFGRGWACGVRNSELRQSVQAPLDRCQVCNHAASAKNPVTDGRCEFHPAHGVRPVNVEYLDPIYDEMPTVSLPGYEAAATKVPARESAVAGWTMVGQNVPKDEWAKWNQLLASEGL